jgi:ACT domain-containing protein
LACATALVAATGTVTVCFTCVGACDTVTINGLVYTGVVGAKACDTQFSVDTCATAVALDLADSIDDDVRCGTLNDVTAVSCAAVITITQTVAGAAGNATTMATSDATAFTLAATFSGGTDATTVTVNGLTYTGVAGAKCGNTEYSIDTSDCAAATDLALSITCDARVGTTITTLDQTAASCAAIVTITAEDGERGNEIDLSSSNSCEAAVSGAFLTGGAGAKVMTVTGNANNHFSAPYINHPVNTGIFIDAVSGTTGTITVIYE